jgi:hypothetical protein
VPIKSAASGLPDPYVVPSQNLDPDVLMMEPAQDRYRWAAELLRRLKMRNIFIQ